jgi:hypothetical protein
MNRHLLILGIALFSFNVFAASCPNGYTQIGTQQEETETAIIIHPVCKLKTPNAYIQYCQEQNRIEVKLCNYPKKTTEAFRQCLAKVRNDFDACMQASGN